MIPQGVRCGHETAISIDDDQVLVLVASGNRSNKPSKSLDGLITRDLRLLEDNSPFRTDSSVIGGMGKCAQQC
eukprot:4230426-Amphidinium_carterae.1